jgi:hypothetical protein
MDSTKVTKLTKIEQGDLNKKFDMNKKNGHYRKTGGTYLWKNFGWEF